MGSRENNFLLLCLFSRYIEYVQNDKISLYSSVWKEILVAYILCILKETEDTFDYWISRIHRRGTPRGTLGYTEVV